MRKIPYAIAVVFLMAIASFGQSGRKGVTQLTVTDLVNKCSGAVVQIVVFDVDGKEMALGSGFIVSADGEIVTNYHVIKGSHSAIAKLPNGSSFSVEGVSLVDKKKDLALLKVGGKNLPFLVLSPDSGVHVGDHVIAIGSPLGLEGSVSDGIISALRKDKPDERWIQTTAPVSHGSSGGPLLNMHGSVVGVITWGLSPQDGQSLNFAIPSDTVQALISSAGKLQGTIVVKSVPADADIDVDGAFIGNSPASVKLSSGMHTITVNSVGFNQWSRELTILPGSELTLTATLDKQPITGEAQGAATTSLKSDEQRHDGQNTHMLLVNLMRTWIIPNQDATVIIEEIEHDNLHYRVKSRTAEGSRTLKVCETRKNGNHWLGKCHTNLSLVRGSATLECSVDLDELITSITPHLIEGESQKLSWPTDRGQCPSASVEKEPFVYKPKY
jgi:S1-C subfamily serine protease